MERDARTLTHRGFQRLTREVHASGDADDPLPRAGDRHAHPSREPASHASLSADGRAIEESRDTDAEDSCEKREIQVHVQARF
jgi:hypothetical protein